MDYLANSFISISLAIFLILLYKGIREFFIDLVKHKEYTILFMAIAAIMGVAGILIKLYLMVNEK